MEKFFKSIAGNTYITVILMVLVVAFIYDQYNRKDFYGMFAVKTPTPVKEAK